VSLAAGAGVSLGAGVASLAAGPGRAGDEIGDVIAGSGVVIAVLSLGGGVSLHAASASAQTIAAARV